MGANCVRAVFGGKQSARDVEREINNLELQLAATIRAHGSRDLEALRIQAGIRALQERKANMELEQTEEFLRESVARQKTTGGTTDDTNRRVARIVTLQTEHEKGNQQVFELLKKVQKTHKVETDKGDVKRAPPRTDFASLCTDGIDLATTHADQHPPGARIVHVDTTFPGRITLAMIGALTDIAQTRETAPVYA
jgi:hypothetical protein